MTYWIYWIKNLHYFQMLLATGMRFDHWILALQFFIVNILDGKYPEISLYFLKQHMEHKCHDEH